MLRIEVLCEDKSSLPVLETLLPQALLDFPQGSWRLAVHAHRGKGSFPKHPEAKPRLETTGLLDLLPAKCRAYQAYWEKAATEALLILVVVDSDDDVVDELYQQLERTIRANCRDLYYVLGISVEEMEAWLLGDEAALSEAYPSYDREAYQTYEQDSICGTWECLAKVVEGSLRAQNLIEIGYPAIGMYKARWAETIAPFLKLERNKSPSLQATVRRLRRFAGLALAEVGDL